MSNDIISCSATNIARRIRERELSPLDVARVFVERIETVNPMINAMITPMFDQALIDARQATESLSIHREYLPPLFGVPITVKDAFAVKGVRFTVGATRYRDQIATRDAKVVQRLRMAGAIILGKTNCPDLCASAETRNLLIGLTRNPWHRDHSAGGSSGGEGALIACGGSPLGVGSDIAGSIRLPAAFCGVFGYKPSPGSIPLAGHLPRTPSVIKDWIVAGPIARHVEDLALAVSVLSGRPVKLIPPSEMKDIRVIIPTSLPMPKLNQEVNLAIRLAAESLEQAGMEIISGEKLPLLKAAFEFSAIMEQEWLPSLLAELGRDKPINLVAELLALQNRRTSTNVLASLLTIAIIGRMLRWRGYGEFESLKIIRTSILDCMEPQGLLLLPVFHTLAPRHGFVWLPDGSPTYTSIFNALGFPACAVPVGFSNKGLPLSVQVVGRPGDDEIVLSIAAILEDMLGVMPIADVGGQFE